ncbi:MAG: Holliday junction branch migration protein RuvA [Pseudomonadales bacterium]|jgi:Holliday junction DNA helicase RuvA
MIGRLRGELIEKTPGEVLLDVGGVGYEIDIPLNTYYALPEIGATVVIYTHLVVREDAQLLFGFSSVDERSLFRTLIKVNGVGPKLAITILSGMEAAEFARAVEQKDVKQLVALPGVGKKTAERLIVEMQDRLKDMLNIAASDAPAPIQQTDSLADAETALINLGYKPQEASRALAGVADPNDSIENLIKQALKNLL